MAEMRRNGVWRMAMIAAPSVMGTVGVALAIAKEIKFGEDPDAAKRMTLLLKDSEPVPEVYSNYFR